jgi:hypothetical protein
MSESEIERALALGAARSAEAAGAPPVAERGTPLPSFWARRRRLIIVITLFLLFDLLVGFVAVTMGTHF